MVERLTATEFKKRADAAEKRKAPWLSSWRDAYRYNLPQRDIIDQPQKGQPKGNIVYDSTGVNDTQRFANRMQSALFPAFQDVIKLTPGPSIPKEQKEQAIELLDDATKKFHVTLHHSNFSTVSNEFFLELGVGTGMMLLQEGPDDDAFQFSAHPTPLVGLEPGPQGTVGGVFRKHKVPISLIPEEWGGPHGAVLPPALETKAKANPDEEVTVDEYTYRDKKTKEWGLDLMVEEGEHFLLPQPWEFGPTSPWIITRWAKAANEVYGRGPILFALPDVRTVNKVVELVLKNASMAVAGVYTGVDDGVFNPNTARFVPGAVIPVARNQGHPQGGSLQPLERSGSFDVAQLILQEMRDNIHTMMFNKSLPPETGGVRSATEILERMRMLELDIGAAFGRIMNEMVKPLVIRGLVILNRKGIITFPFAIDGNTIEIEVTSPLANQQNLNDVQAVVQWMQLMAQMGPEMLIFGMNVEDLPAWMGRKLGVDEELIRGETGRALIKQFVQQFIQQGQGGGGGDPTTQAGVAVASGAQPAPQPAGASGAPL